MRGLSNYHKVAYGLLLFSILISVLLVIELPNQTNATGENWLAGWKYRKAYTLESVSGEGFDYAVPVVVINASGTDSGNTTYTSHVLPNFKDVRFTDSDGDTELNYYMGVLNTGANATFIVEVPRNISESHVTIFMYYGNSSGPVSTTNNGAATLARTRHYDSEGMTGTWSTEAVNDSSGTTYEINSSYTLDGQKDSSWLKGWTHRYEQTILRTPGAGTGYQIPFNVYYGDGTDDDSKFATFISDFKWKRYPEVMTPTYSWEGGQNTKRANIADPDIIVESNQLAMYYTGFLPNDNGTIALATSPLEFPPRNWTKQGIILQNDSENSTAWDRAFVRLGSVVKVNGIYYMYYDGASASFSGESIGLATSTNGLSFARYSGNPVLSASGTEKTVREASVIVVNGTWYMIYSHDDGLCPTLCHKLLATSTDGYTWKKQGAILAKGAPGTPDDVYMEHHQLAYIYGRFVLTYDEYDGSTWSIGCAYSTVANTTYKKLGKILAPSGVSGTFDRVHCATPFFFNNGESWYMMYQGADAPWETTCWDMGVVSKVYDRTNVYLHRKSNTDFSDLRFTASDGSTSLSYRAEFVTIGGGATFWVKLNANLSVADQTIYIYCGKRSKPVE